jgi:hypothetical protein
VRGETPYKALSYTWGAPNLRRWVSINGEIISIGSNLEEALRELRDTSDEVVIWADQLCINQNDDDEKSSQVQQMKDIYAKASCVISWLGAADLGTDLIFNRLKQLAKDGAVQNYKQIIQDHQSNVVLPSIISAFTNFCHRPYWSRLWIIQEFAVGRELIIACGGIRISYQELLQAILFIQLVRNYTPKPTSNESLKRAILRLANIYSCPAFSFVQGPVSRRQRYQSETYNPENTFFRILNATLVIEIDYNHPNCTEPRDRIFSVLGLANDADEFYDLLDYSRSCEDIYEATTRKFLDQGNIDILSYCQFPKMSHMASWVPDWRRATQRPCMNSPWLSHFSASEDSLALQRVTHADPSILELQGTFVDTIKATGRIWDPNWLSPLDADHVEEYLDDILAFCHESSRIQEDMEDLATSIIAIGDLMISTDEGVEQSCLASYRELRQTLQQDPKPQLNTNESPYEPFMRFLHTRRPYISTTGLVGLLPQHAKPGDVIYIFLGGRTPYVLRVREDGYHTLVGETYAHGVMYGQYMKDNPKIETIKLK